VTRHTVVTLAAVGAFLGVTSCAGGADCTEIGGVSQVVVDLVALGPNVGGSTVCVESTCVDSLGAGQALATLPSDEPASYAVSVTVHDGDGAVLAEGKGSFSTEELRPNGPGCDPVLQQLNLVMQPDGSLAPRGAARP
jgi:hypothetical protein